MADLKYFKPEVTVKATIELDEGDLAALDALAGYGTDAFLKVFYERLGEAYLKPHEKSLRKIFSEIRRVAPVAIKKAEEARAQLKKASDELAGRAALA
ncbi:hypothetical protein V5F34_08770 [Xanthobacter autotrophicus]|uniref:hypothetical protein n=1 Tax=Xanthobacter autotrophicus TaxID=280 RepID=UPI003726A24C